MLIYLFVPARKKKIDNPTFAFSTGSIHSIGIKFIRKLISAMLNKKSIFNFLANPLGINFLIY